MSSRHCPHGRFCVDECVICSQPPQASKPFYVVTTSSNTGFNIVEVGERRQIVGRFYRREVAERFVSAMNNPQGGADSNGMFVL